MKVAAKVEYKKLQWGKRVQRKGRYKQVLLDARGKKVAEVPWGPQLRMEMRALQAAVEGKPSKRALRVLGFKVSGWKLSDVDARTGEPTFARRVWSGSVPIGEPGGRVTGPREGRSGRWLGQAFAAIEPDRWAGTLRAAALELADPRHVYIGIRLGAKTADGTEVRYAYPPTFRLAELMDDVVKMRGFLAMALSDLGREYGYGGRLQVTTVDLSLVALLEGMGGVISGPTMEEV
jgi:hypothetical protein